MSLSFLIGSDLAMEVLLTEYLAVSSLCCSIKGEFVWSLDYVGFLFHFPLVCYCPTSCIFPSFPACRFW